MCKAALLAVILWHIQMLDHDDYNVRNKADKWLYSVLPVAAPYLESAVTSARLSPEARRRCYWLLRHHRYTSAPCKLKWIENQIGVIPWCDARDPHDRYYIEHYNAWLSKVHEETDLSGYSPDWPSYREATKQYLLRLLRDGRDPQELLQILRKMAVYENEWIDSHSKNYHPPLKRTVFK